MADISMCANKECPSRDICYRYTATVNPYRQAYSDYEFDESGKCSSFTPNKKEEK